MSGRHGPFRELCAVGLIAVLAAIGSQVFAESQAGDVFTLDTCPVSGAKLGSMGDPVVKTYDGREIRFCCAGCPAKFEADPESYLQKINAALVEQQKPFYPLGTCVVSGEKLGGDMGEPVDRVYNNRLVRFCCKGCVNEFAKDPAKYIAKLDQAVIEKQKDSYPLDVCVVSGEKLGGDMGEPIDYIVGNRLVRFCCKGCVKQFEKTPAKYLSTLDDALAGKQAIAPAEGSHAEHGEQPRS